MVRQDKVCREDATCLVELWPIEAVGFLCVLSYCFVYCVIHLMRISRLFHEISTIDPGLVFLLLLIGYGRPESGHLRSTSVSWRRNRHLHPASRDRYRLGTAEIGIPMEKTVWARCAIEPAVIGADAVWKSDGNADAYLLRNLTMVFQEIIMERI
jgi:hypothetical protein